MHAPTHATTNPPMPKKLLGLKPLISLLYASSIRTIVGLARLCPNAHESPFL